MDPSLPPPPLPSDPDSEPAQLLDQLLQSLFDDFSFWFQRGLVLLELTPDTLVTNFVFSIPPHAPPSFRTPMASLRWVVRFELSICWPKGGRGGRGQPDPLVWALPIGV